jgi:hypothetical protein
MTTCPFDVTFDLAFGDIASMAILLFMNEFWQVGDITRGKTLTMEISYSMSIVVLCIYLIEYLPKARHTPNR